jgi:hypothetical protein
MKQVASNNGGTVVAADPPLEQAVAPWQFLVRRHHPWRKQLDVKGRNMTARQLVGSIKANGFDGERAALDHHLPVEAIREAQAYVDQHRKLLETEAEIERLMGQREGAADLVRQAGHAVVRPTEAGTVGAKDDVHFRLRGGE